MLGNVFLICVSKDWTQPTHIRLFRLDMEIVAHGNFISIKGC